MKTSIDTDLSDGPFAESLYIGYTSSTAATSANHGRMRAAYSRDGGASWTPVTVHPTADADTVGRWQESLPVGWRPRCNGERYAPACAASFRTIV